MGGGEKREKETALCVHAKKKGGEPKMLVRSVSMRVEKERGRRGKISPGR